MNYTIELDKDELKILKRLVKDEFNFRKSPVTFEDETKLLLLIGKLENVVMVADNIIGE
jgi:hypothetical protein